MTIDIWICIEQGKNNCSAYAPEVPGCVSTGRTVEETKRNMEEALKFHLESMLEDGESLDGITGAFPVAEARDAGDASAEDEYFALIHITLTPAHAPVKA